MNKAKIEEELQLLETIMLGYQPCIARDDVLRGLQVIRREIQEEEVTKMPFQPVPIGKRFSLHYSSHTDFGMTLEEIKPLVFPHEFGAIQSLSVGGTYEDEDGDTWERTQ